MTLSSYIKKIMDKPSLWKYYVDGSLKAPNLSDYKDCRDFIFHYIKDANKICKLVRDGLSYFYISDRDRLCHIANTYFLGLALYYDEKLNFKPLLRNTLKEYDVFHQEDEKCLDSEFHYMWFMLTLFHDLGYIYERDQDRHYHLQLTPNITNCKTVPSIYAKVVENYLKYRNNKDHGICGGLDFDREICQIRRSNVSKDKRLSWRPELEQVYHDVAWVIAAHNIWWYRTDDKALTEGLKHYKLSSLILSTVRNGTGQYGFYPIRKNMYPLLFLFCLVDSIEPLKRSISLENVEIETAKNTIVLKPKDYDLSYLKTVIGMNDWLTVTTLQKDGRIEIKCE